MDSCVIDLCGIEQSCENVIVTHEEHEKIPPKAAPEDDEEYIQFVREHYSVFSAPVFRTYYLSNYVPTLLLTLARPFDPAWMIDIAEEQARFEGMSDCDVYMYVCNTSNMHWPRETIRELVVSYVQTLTGNVGEQVELLDMHERGESQFSWELVKASREDMTKILAMMDSIAGRKTVL